ncbi:membrane protein [Phytohabitans suffuscus]|uniref:Membrane protein n=1 Tax=Phytohabitans suffuscus TaxID=624315 RepID=A0A6F8YTH5_9ACTN|nr:SPW repeat protein [Phytohabitans suffuscus]BCB89414.1 membrane protein [Phytohabitans suffuscus]
MLSSTESIARHPDIAALRTRFERAAELPVAQAIEGLGFMAGLFLAISPWVLGFSDLPALAISNLVTGIALMVLALGFASAFERTHGVAWVAPLIGVWTILAPWLVEGPADTTTTIWNNVVVGGVCTLLGLVALPLVLRRGRRL